MLATTTVRGDAVIVAVAPALLLLGFASHPYVANATDEAALADAAAAETTRWGLAHLAIGVGYALLALAFVALRAYLLRVSDEPWSRRALPFAVVGSALFPILTGMEFALLGAAETGGDGEAVQSELVPWFVPVLLAAGISLAIGAIGFALAVRRGQVLAQRHAAVVAAALVVASLVRFVPLGAAQIVIGVALVVALWPLALAIWREPAAEPASA